MPEDLNLFCKAWHISGFHIFTCHTLHLSSCFCECSCLSFFDWKDIMDMSSCTLTKKSEYNSITKWYKCKSSFTCWVKVFYTYTTHKMLGHCNLVIMYLYSISDLLLTVWMRNNLHHDWNWNTLTFSDSNRHHTFTCIKNWLLILWPLEVREISLTTGAGGLLNWANFPVSFHWSPRWRWCSNGWSPPFSGVENRWSPHPPTKSAFISWRTLNNKLIM